jgi:hypothetical protein
VSKAAIAAVVSLSVVAMNFSEIEDWVANNAFLVAWDQHWTADGLRYKRATCDQAAIALSAAGAASYFSERPSIDLLGKSDRHIARIRPVRGSSRPGHNKFDYRYSLVELRPDLVAPLLLFQGGLGYRPTGEGEFVRVDATCVTEAELRYSPDEARLARRAAATVISLSDD